MKISNHKFIKLGRNFKIVLVLIIIANLFFASVGNTFAQSNDGSVSLSFEQLGFSTLQLSSKLESLSGRSFTDEVIDFAIPYRWVLVGDGANYLELHYSISLIRNEQLDDLSTKLPKLEVYVDNTVIADFVPAVGANQTTRIEIPSDVINQRSSNRHFFRFVYLNVRDCIQDVEYVLTVHNDSAVTFSYTETEPVLSLIDFPRPLVQDSFLPEDIYFILPESYSDAELSAVVSLSQAMGDRGGGDVNLNIVSDADFASGQLPQGNMIVVGQPLENQVLADLYQQNLLPTKISDQGAILGPEGLVISSTDGVLQLVNDNNTLILVVTGNSGEAIGKAATALASANPLYGLAGDLSVISDVIEDTAVPVSEDSGVVSMLFSDLGIQDVNLVGVGTQSVGATFYLPYDWKILENPTLTVSYANSATLNSNSSIINVELNNNLVGSVPLDNTSLGRKKVSIELSPEEFIPGEKNRLKLTAVMDNSLNCNQSNDFLAWVQIFSDSGLEIPREIITSTSDEPQHFINPFFYLLSSNQPSKILFVTPETVSLTDFGSITRMAYLLGREQGSSKVELSMTTDSTYSPENYSDYHTILIGRPTTNSAIVNVNDYLVQPFAAGEDALLQGVGNVKYVLPPSYSVGVVQAIASPWSLGKGITVISGTTELAMEWALNTMTAPDLVRQLNGDLVFVYQDNIEAINSQTATHKAVETTIENVTNQTVETTAAPESASPADNNQIDQPNNGNQANSRLIVGIALLVLAIAGFVGIVVSFVSQLRKARAGSDK